MPSDTSARDATLDRGATFDAALERSSIGAGAAAGAVCLTIESLSCRASSRPAAPSDVAAPVATLPTTAPVLPTDDDAALSANPAFSELHAEASSSTAAAWMILLEGTALGFRMEATPGKTV